MIVKLLIEHHLEFLSLTEDCRGPSESTLVKMSNCWKSHAAAHIIQCIIIMLVLNYLNLGKKLIEKILTHFKDPTAQSPQPYTRSSLYSQ